MLIGFNAPVAGPLTEPEALAWTAPEGKAMGFDYLAFIDHIARSARTGVSHIDFGFGGSTTDEMLTTMRFPRRGFGANLTSRPFSAFIDAACASGAFGEFA
jgi:hypothetical protein